MVEVAKIILWDNFVGALAWDSSKNYAFFEFDNKFLKNGLDIAPIKMPIDEALEGSNLFSFPLLNFDTFKGLPGLFADSLPDRFGNKLIDAWLVGQSRTVNTMNSIERLCYIGKRGMGALEYEPAFYKEEHNSHSLEIDELVRLTKDILAEKVNFSTSIKNKGVKDIIKIGTSAGGARAKAVIAYNQETGDVRSGQIDGLKGYDYWLLKFDGVTNKQLGDPIGFGKIEYAYYLMAKECGIDMMESRLLKENDRHHFITKRFDRLNSEKLHVQTLCALEHFDYNEPAMYSYEQAFQTMRKLRLPFTDAEQFFRRMVFNVVARNQDDHTKNISFIMDKQGVWRLSSAYDITYSYNPESYWTRVHQMSINGKRHEITLTDILEVGKQMNIKKAKDIVEQISSVVSNWYVYASKSEIKTEQAKKILKQLYLNIC